MRMPLSVRIVEQKRLEGEILIFRNEVGNFDWRGNQQSKNAAIEELDKADKEAGNCEIDKGWIHQQNAEQFLVKAMDGKQLINRAAILLVETEKLGKMRKEQINTLLKDFKTDNNPDAADTLLNAIRIRNDFYHTRNHKVSLLRTNANILTLSMFVNLVLILILSFVWDLPHMDISQPDIFPKALLISVLFGAQGASFSFAKTLFSFDLGVNKVPDQIVGMIMISIRFVIGATAAMVIFFLFRSGFLNELFTKSILDSSITFIVFSFIAGFSERWVIKMLGLVTKENV